MKKEAVIPFLILLLLGLVVISCGGGKYADVIKLNQEYIGLLETYVADIDKAGNAQSVAKAMNKYADGLEKVWPRMKAVSEKYPELKDKENPPEELKASQQEAEAWSMKMGASFQKIMPYMNDPDVKKAQVRISAVMRS